MQNRLFQMTHWRLALWYAGIMGLILSLSGLACYRIMAHANQAASERELESVAGTLHDSIEPTLNQPGSLNPKTQQLLPELCSVGARCRTQMTRRC